MCVAKRLVESGIRVGERGAKSIEGLDLDVHLIVHCITR